MADESKSLQVDLIIPVYNERDNLIQFPDRLIAPLREVADEWTFTLYLMADESDDGSQTVCEELAAEHPEVRAVLRNDNPGFGNAIKHGFRVSDGDVVAPLMADFSDDPADVAAMVEQIREGYDVVYGSRFVADGTYEGYPRLKLLYNRAFNNFIRLLFGLGRTDITNAFKAYRREVIDEIGVDNITSESFDITVEIPLRAHVLGFRSTEIGISWRSRDEGVSKLNVTRKGPLYLLRVLQIFAGGALGGIKDIFDEIVSQSVYYVFGALLLGVLLLFGISSIIGIDQIADTIAEVQPIWLVGTGGAYVLSFLVRTWRWRVLLRTSGHLASRAAVFRSIMTGWFFNFLLPARLGDVARGLTLKTTEDVPFGVATGTIVIERMLDMLVLGSTVLILGMLILPIRQAMVLAAGAAGVAAVLATILGVVYFFDGVTVSLLERTFSSVEESVKTAQEGLRQAAANPYGMALATLLSVPVWISEVSTLYFSSRAIGLQLTTLETITVGVAAFITQAIPVTPAAIGTYETAITGVLSAMGIDPAAASALGPIDHVVRISVVMVIGAVTTVHIGFQSQSYFRDRHQSPDTSEAETD